MPQVPDLKSILDGHLGNGNALLNQEGELLFQGELVGRVVALGIPLDAILGDLFGEGIEVLAGLLNLFQVEE